MTHIGPFSFLVSLVIIPKTKKTQQDTFNLRTFQKGTNFTFQAQAQKPCQGEFFALVKSQLHIIDKSDTSTESIQLVLAIQTHKIQPHNQLQDW